MAAHQKITLLGSTGSIGRSSLEVIALNSDQYSIFALCAFHQDELLFQQCLLFSPRYAVLVDELAATRLKERIKASGLTTDVLVGQSALVDMVEHDDCDTVISAITGSQGLIPTLKAIQSNKKVLLANKESLVVAGELMMDAVRASSSVLLPIDSEHNAIFQALSDDFLPGDAWDDRVKSIILTASGGPFRSFALSDMSEVTLLQALAHPTWSMGEKISIDSATMMNKGLEFIEAYWLFAPPTLGAIEVVIHPQSIVHSMVRYRDGSVIAQMGVADMKIPIAYSLAYPARCVSGASDLDFYSIPALQFEPVDYQRYSCLSLAIESLKVGGTASVVLNAANEVAVDLFLKAKISFLQIAEVIDATLQQFTIEKVEGVEHILSVDHRARLQAHEHCVVSI